MLIKPRSSITPVITPTRSKPCRIATNPYTAAVIARLFPRLKK